MGNQKSVPLPSPQPGGPGRLRSCNLHCFFVGGPGFQRPTADFISFGSFSCFSFTCPGRPHRVGRGIAQGGFQRSVLKSLLRGEPQSRCVPAGLAGGQRARRGGEPARPGFSRRGNGKGEIEFLAPQAVSAAVPVALPCFDGFVYSSLFQWATAQAALPVSVSFRIPASPLRSTPSADELLRCLEMGILFCRPAELFSLPHNPQQLTACLQFPKRFTSPISSAHVSAVTGPAAGIVNRRFTLSSRSGSLRMLFSSSFSVFRTCPASSGSTAAAVPAISADPRRSAPTPGNTSSDAVSACCIPRRLPSTGRSLCSSSA